MTPSRAISLHPITNPDDFFDGTSKTSILCSLWPALRASTMDAAQPHWFDISNFQANCLYFARIDQMSPAVLRLPVPLARNPQEVPIDVSENLDDATPQTSFSQSRRQEDLS